MKPFNVRVYALLEHKGKLLVIHEPFQGKLIYKFPGGGLEFGEGTIECVKREFLEELNLKISVESHYYTQDFFKESAFDKDEQILLIYYKARVEDDELAKLKILDPDIEALLWIAPQDLNINDFQLDADKVVIRQYQNENILD